MGSGSKDTTDSRFSDLEIIYWNIRGKTVQDILDILHGVMHPPDRLMLQEVGGLGKGEPDSVLSFEVWSGSGKYSCFHVDSAEGFRQIWVAIRHPFPEYVQKTSVLSVGLGVILTPRGADRFMR